LRALVARKATLGLKRGVCALELARVAQDSHIVTLHAARLVGVRSEGENYYRISPSRKEVVYEETVPFEVT
jgi:hypothetical protein